MKLNVREMHIELNQSLQKISASRTRKFLPEELDWVLNKIQGRFIQSKLIPRKGNAFTYNQLEVDAIRPLLVKAKLPAYIDTEFPNRYKSYLPTDYSYLIADYSYVDNSLCRTQKLIQEEVSLYLYWLKQSRTTKVNAPFYENGTITVNGSYIINFPGDLPYTNDYVGYPNKKDNIFLYAWIKHELNQMAKEVLQVGSEQYGEWYKGNNFVFVSEQSITPPTLVLDGINVTLTSQSIEGLKKYPQPDEAIISPNRLESSEDVLNLVTTPFYKPTINSPVSELNGQILYTYGSSSFTISSCGINYVRKPRPISLSLGSDCELMPEFHQTICDLATQYIKGRLENVPAEQLVEKDIETRVTL